MCCVALGKGLPLSLFLHTHEMRISVPDVLEGSVTGKLETVSTKLF